MPAAIVGTIAITLASAPAAEARVADAGESRTLRALPAAGLAPAAGAAVKTAAVPASYTVRRGDTISGIAARFGLRTAEVLSLNGLSWRSTIYPGQVLRLTGAAASSTLKTATTTKTTTKTYTVRSGDTISGIAARHKVTTASVLTANKLSRSSIIYPGQKLSIPGVSTTAGSATASASTSAAKTATTTKTTKTYTVRSGDTISGIAARHKVTTASVLKANRLSWSSIIHPGQKLSIPGVTATSGGSAAGTSSSSGGSTSASAAGARSYTVRAGDTISGIASRHKVSVASVLSANGLGWSSIIYPGQTIAIPSAGLAGLDAEQIENARLIVRIGRELGVPDKGIAIALGTAMQESWIRNLDWGDRDSLGLFQQRPSTGWGTAAQVRDRDRSIRAFYGGPRDPNGSRTRGLLDIPGWQKMSFTQAAQAVQISAYPDRYAQWEKQAYRWLAALG